MITKTDAVILGKTIVASMKKEEAYIENTNMSLPVKTQARCSARGAIINVLDNLWYDIFPDKVKESFGMNRNNFYVAVGWE